MANKQLSRAILYGKGQSSKHKFNTMYSNYISKLTVLQRKKLVLICDRYKIEPYELRDKEFALVSTNKIVTKLFKRARRHRLLYESYNTVLSA